MSDDAVARPVADVLFAHDEGRVEPGPPDGARQRRAHALSRPFWWAPTVRTVGALLAAAGFVVAPTSPSGIALMTGGVVVVVAAVVVRRVVGPRYGEAVLDAGLPVPPDRSEDVRSVALAIEETLHGISEAGENGLHPPRTRRIHARTRVWDRTAERLRGHWLRGDDARWRATANRLAGHRADAERWRSEIEEHLRHQASDPAEP